VVELLKESVIDNYCRLNHNYCAVSEDKTKVAAVSIADAVGGNALRENFLTIVEPAENGAQKKTRFEFAFTRTPNNSKPEYRLCIDGYKTEHFVKKVSLNNVVVSQNHPKMECKGNYMDKQNPRESRFGTDHQTLDLNDPAVRARAEEKFCQYIGLILEGKQKQKLDDEKKKKEETQKQLKLLE
jgi:hypothetical protein